MAESGYFRCELHRRNIVKKIVEKLVAKARKVLDGFGIKVTDEQVGHWMTGVGRKFLFWTPVVLVYCILIVAAVLLNFFEDPIEIFDEKYGTGTIMLCTLLLYTVASLRIIGPKEL